MISREYVFPNRQFEDRAGRGANLGQPKWSGDGLYVWDNSVVGTVRQAPNKFWYARGCEDDWEDVNLGAHNTEAAAKKAVKNWVSEKMRIACK